MSRRQPLAISERLSDLFRVEAHDGGVRLSIRNSEIVLTSAEIQALIDQITDAPSEANQ